LPERPGDPLILYADAGKAKSILNWTAKTSIKDGVENTVAYFTNIWTNENS
jgi:UDP-glucose 4-epimerase